MTRAQFLAWFIALLGGAKLSAQAQIAKESIIVGDISEHEPGIGAVDGKNGVFTLSYGPVAAASLKVFQNGLRQRQGTDYTLNGKVITFAATPPLGNTIDVDYRGYFG